MSRARSRPRGRRPSATLGLMQAVDRFAARLPANWRFELQSLPIAARSKSTKALPAPWSRRARAILSALRKSERLIALDEQRDRGRFRRPSPSDLQRLAGGRVRISVSSSAVRMGCRQDVAVRAPLHRWSLSQLTLPHGLARVLVRRAALSRLVAARGPSVP